MKRYVADTAWVKAVMSVSRLKSSCRLRDDPRHRSLKKLTISKDIAAHRMRRTQESPPLWASEVPRSSGMRPIFC